MTQTKTSLLPPGLRQRGEGYDAGTLGFIIFFPHHAERDYEGDISKQASMGTISLQQGTSAVGDSAQQFVVEEPEEPCPDGGYGWVCVLCSFVFHFFAIGCVRTLPQLRGCY